MPISIQIKSLYPIPRMFSISTPARIELREREEAVIFRSNCFTHHLIQASEKTDYEARGDYFSGKGVTLDTFADYLESFGVVDKPVVNETAIDGYYTIEFSFDPENPDSFYKSLGEMGIGIKRASRPIEVLVLYE